MTLKMINFTTECLFPKNAKIGDKNSENCCVNVTHEARATFRQQETEVPDSQTLSLFLSLFFAACAHSILKKIDLPSEETLYPWTLQEGCTVRSAMSVCELCHPTKWSPCRFAALDAAASVKRAGSSPSPHWVSCLRTAGANRRSGSSTTSTSLELW